VAGAVIVSGIEINTGGGAEVAAPTDKQQAQAKRGLGKASQRSSRRVLTTLLTPPPPLHRPQITYFVDARDGSEARHVHYSTVMPFGQVKDCDTQGVYDLTGWMNWRRQVCSCSCSCSCCCSCSAAPYPQHVIGCGAADRCSAEFQQQRRPPAVEA
jgi:hypothetical protein